MLPPVVLDLVFFQLNDTGIARYWAEVLHKWSTDVDDSLRERLVVLVRDSFARTPKLLNIDYLHCPPLDYKANPDVDRAMLQQVCNSVDAELFMSTYYTTPVTTPSVFMAYDFIPEVLGHDLTTPMWQAKAKAIAQAGSYVSISDSTALDLVTRYKVQDNKISIAQPGVSKLFAPASNKSFGVQSYLLLSSPGPSYKNGKLLLDALANDKALAQKYKVIVTGSSSQAFVDKAEQSHPGVWCEARHCNDRELVRLYQNATALVYPSFYEGWGLPIVEAMSCGCPVITGRQSSLAEAGGDAPLYIDCNSVAQLQSKLWLLDNVYVKYDAIAKGLRQAKNFSWHNTANSIKKALLQELM